MEELINDIFYEEYNKYNQCELDYAIYKIDNYKGIETHKEAIRYFMDKNDYDIQIDKMECTSITSEELFKLPDNREEERSNVNIKDYHRPYWYLFLDPPYGTKYTIDDFIKINNILFPNGKDNLEIYDWNVNWSNYFNDGLEWWGARCTSIYDKTINRIVIILASSTD